LLISRAKGPSHHSTLSVELPEIDQRWHIKLRPFINYDQLRNEANRTLWAQGHLPVPERVYAKRLPGVSLLITQTLDGSASYKHIGSLEPKTIIDGVFSAIKALSKVDVVDFPFEPPHWATEQGVGENLKLLTTSRTKRRNLHPDFAELTQGELEDIIDTGPGDVAPTISHGDLCMPNVLLGPEGTMTGIVDLGSLHSGNSQLDLAIMSWSVQANMGNEWASYLLGLCGCSASDGPIVFNRLVYDLGLEHSNPWGWMEDRRMSEQRERLSE